MNKVNSAYKTIGEVARILELNDEKKGSLKTHTIRFWEKKFKQIKPKIFNGNRRYYDKKNIELLKTVHFLLKEKGMTINGAKKALHTGSIKLDPSVLSDIKGENFKQEIKDKINKIKKLLEKIKKIK